MTFATLLIIAFGGTFSIIWLINYIPLTSSFAGSIFSPRLLLCKFLAPADAALTLFLVMGAWTGLATTVTGISMVVYNVLTGIGISMGVLFVKRFLVPRWIKQFDKEAKDLLLAKAQAS